MPDIRKLPKEQRSASLYHAIDPGFMNRRKCFTVFGPRYIEAYHKSARPGSGWPTDVHNDWVMVDLALIYCKAKKVKTLAECLDDPMEGDLFCSTESLEGTDFGLDTERVKNRILLPYDYPKDVFLEFGTKHFVSDTGRHLHGRRSKLAIIGELREVDEEIIYVHPIIMGLPSFSHPDNRHLPFCDKLDWFAYQLYDTVPEDLDEFSKLDCVEPPPPDEWMPYMEATPEIAVKERFCKLLGDLPKKDWGGEKNDHYSSSLHLNDRRISAAFIFKGPHDFREMTPDMLGKRANQIIRLAQTPAELLVVQHCHTIGEDVREMLRAVAVRPHDPRRYCLIDGKDTYRIFKAYGIL